MADDWVFECLDCGGRTSTQSKRPRCSHCNSLHGMTDQPGGRVMWPTEDNSAYKGVERKIQLQTNLTVKSPIDGVYMNDRDKNCTRFKVPEELSELGPTLSEEEKLEVEFEESGHGWRISLSETGTVYCPFYRYEDSIFTRCSAHELHSGPCRHILLAYNAYNNEITELDGVYGEPMLPNIHADNDETLIAVSEHMGHKGDIGNPHDRLPRRFTVTEIKEKEPSNTQSPTITESKTGSRSESGELPEPGQHVTQIARRHIYDAGEVNVRDLIEFVHGEEPAGYTSPSELYKAVLQGDLQEMDDVIYDNNANVWRMKNRDSLDLSESVLEIDFPGPTENQPQQQNAVQYAYDLIKEKEQVPTRELIECTYDEYTGSYESPSSLYTSCLRTALKQLTKDDPNLEYNAETNTWIHTTS